MRIVFLLVVAVAVTATARYTALTKPVSTAEPNMAESKPVVSAAEMPLHIAELRNLQQAHRPATAFWRTDEAAEAQRVAAILQAERHARAALIARYGEQVRDHELFWPLFRPLHTSLPELSSAMQIVLHELEQTFFIERRGEPTATFGAHLENVRDALGEQATLEYALRASPLSAELRDAGLPLSESEFRAAFTALSDLSAADNAQQFLVARRALRNETGHLGFARLWSKRDPQFSLIQSTARDLDLTDDQLMSAYALMLENQDAMLAIVGQDGEIGQVETIREQFAAGRRRLQSLVGERAASALLHAASAEPDQID